MNRNKNYFGQVLIAAALLSFGLIGLAKAAVIYDGANTTGVTTDDQYIIDYDDTSTGNITLDFGSDGSKYLRYDTLNSKFQISNNLDFQSNQLLDARVQNVGAVSEIPACAAVSDAGKIIFITSTFVNTLPSQTLTVNNFYVCNAAGNLWLGIPTGFSSSDFLSSNSNTTYLGGGLGNNTITFGAPGNAVNVSFDPNNASVDLQNTIANNFVFNNDAANGDVTTLSFGDGSGSFTWDDANSLFSLNNSLSVSGNVNLNGNQLLSARIENVSTLPTCNAGATGLNVFLTTGVTGTYTCDGTNWIKQSTDGTTATMEFSPEFKDATVRPDGANNIGTMTSDTDDINNRNYYRWTTNNAALQDIDIVVDARLPDDFKAFAASNNFQYDIRANDTVNTKVKMDISGKDTTSTAMTISGTVAGIVPALANTWQTNSHTISGGTYTAGSRIQLTFHLAALKDVTSRAFDLGNFRLNYIRK